jgi:hypothetical protein
MGSGDLNFPCGILQAWLIVENLRKWGYRSLVTIRRPALSLRSRENACTEGNP